MHAIIDKVDIDQTNESYGLTKFIRERFSKDFEQQNILTEQVLCTLDTNIE